MQAAASWLCGTPVVLPGADGEGICAPRPSRRDEKDNCGKTDIEWGDGEKLVASGLHRRQNGCVLADHNELNYHDFAAHGTAECCR